MLPTMIEVFALMSPSYWMKLCFEIAVERGTRSVSAGNLRSWSLSLSLPRPPCAVPPDLWKRTMVVSSVCVYECVCSSFLIVRCCFKCSPVQEHYTWMTGKQRNKGFHFMQIIVLIGDQVLCFPKQAKGKPYFQKLSMYSMHTLALTLCEKSRQPIANSIRKLNCFWANSLSNLMTSNRK